MIILLPLRGWMGDAMATQMASQMNFPALAQQQVAIESIAANAHESGASAHFDAQVANATASVKPDCADHMNGNDPMPSTASHCDSCTLCQACSAVLIAEPLPGLAAMSTSPCVPAATARRFASADRALGLKPPIS
jgi:hypothetical protein